MSMCSRSRARYTKCLAALLSAAVRPGCTTLDVVGTRGCGCAAIRLRSLGYEALHAFDIRCRTWQHA